MPLQDSPCTKLLINDECELTFANHKVQALIAKKIDLKYNIDVVLTMPALIVALGAMVISFAAVSKNNEFTYLLATFVAIFILLVSVIFIFALRNKNTSYLQEIDDQIKQISESIQTYNQKSQGHEK